MQEVEFISKRDGKKFIIREGSYDRVIIDGEWPGYRKRITISSHDVWLDIGAHIGAFSLRVAPLAKEVHAYEADPYNFSVLKKNIELNPTSNLYVTNGAVVGMCKPGDKVPFYKNTGMNTGLHSLVTKRGRDKIEVPAFDIRQVLFESGANKMKLDIEGGEWDLFSNFHDSMFRQLDELIMEYHFSALRDVDHSKFHYLRGTLKQFFPIVETFPENPTLKQWTCMIHAAKEKVAVEEV